MVVTRIHYPNYVDYPGLSVVYSPLSAFDDFAANSERGTPDNRCP